MAGFSPESAGRQGEREIPVCEWKTFSDREKLALGDQYRRIYITDPEYSFQPDGSRRRYEVMHLDPPKAIFDLTHEERDIYAQLTGISLKPSHLAETVHHAVEVLEHLPHPHFPHPHLQLPRNAA